MGRTNCCTGYVSASGVCPDCGEEVPDGGKGMSAEITFEDLKKAIKVLDAANVPEPYFVITPEGEVLGPYGKTQGEIDEDRNRGK